MNSRKFPPVCILMGVSGSGKTTIGQLLSQKLDWEFYEGDDFHPADNVDKMSQGIPLNDCDRQPWLNSLGNLLEQLQKEKKPALLACSALKQSYRDFLESHHDHIIWIYLQGTHQQLCQRLEQRKNHFMKEKMLQSQLETLEKPQKAFTINISLPPEEIVNRIVKIL